MTDAPTTGAALLRLHVGQRVHIVWEDAGRTGMIPDADVLAVGERGDWARVRVYSTRWRCRSESALAPQRVVEVRPVEAQR